MDPLDPSDKPPRPIPPAPPRPELVASPRPPAASQPLTPMMEFFQRRVEALERELALERERATTAQNLISHQEALRGEVDAHLKAMTEQIRREKGERDSDEARVHARGRVDALEKRLDEMHATFAELLKEAVARSSSAAAPMAEALGAELTVFRRTIKEVADQVERWRGEMASLPELLPEVRALARRVPEDEGRFEAHIARRLDEFAAKVEALVADLDRRQGLEGRKLEERVSDFAREREAMARLWEEQGHAIRQEHARERIARETAVGDQVADLARRLDELAAGRRESAAGAAHLDDGIRRILAHLTATPKAKDQIIEALEQEKADLSKALHARVEETRRFAFERRDIEKSLGDGLLKLTAELEAERARVRGAQDEAAALRGRVAELASRVADLERVVSERDVRLESVSAERDELTRALVAESEKLRGGLASRADSEARWNARVLELQRRVEEENAVRAAESATAADLRAKLAALSDHLARALQEKDATIARFSDWDKERRRLLDLVSKKDEMISMLSSAFQGSLKKP